MLVWRGGQEVFVMVTKPRCRGRELPCAWDEAPVPDAHVPPDLHRRSHSRPRADHGRGVHRPRALSSDPRLLHSARQRSGRAGDFFTSVDVGRSSRDARRAARRDVAAGRRPGESSISSRRPPATAGSPGRARRRPPRRPSLLRRRRAASGWKRSAAARAAQRDTLGLHAGKLASSQEALPAGVTGVIFANELPRRAAAAPGGHAGDGLREVRVAERDGRARRGRGPALDARDRSLTSRRRAPTCGRAGRLRSTSLPRHGCARPRGASIAAS